MNGLFLLCALSLSGLVQQGRQEGGWVDLRFHRVYLRNGNFIDGHLVRQTAKEVVLKLATGEMSIRHDLIDRVEYVKMRGVNEKPTEVVRPKPPDTSKEKSVVTGARRDPLTPPPPPERRPPAEAKEFVSGRKPEQLYQPSSESKSQVTAILEEFFRGDPESRPLIAEKLGKVEGDAGPYLASLLETFDRDELGYITAAITVLQDKRAVAVLSKQLESPNPVVRMHAANTLGTFQDAAAATAVQTVLHDKDPNVRGAAITAVQTFGAIEAFPDLVTLLGDPEREIRTRAISTLSDLAARHQRVPELESAMVDEIRRAKGVAKMDLVGALGRTLRPESWNLVTPYLADDEPQIRASAASSLAALGAVEAGDALVRQIQSESERSVRVPMAGAAGKLKAKGAVDHLIAWLADPADDVQSAARLALTSLTGQNFGSDAEKWKTWWEANK